jgi:hypothetical protein
MNVQARPGHKIPSSFSFSSLLVLVGIRHSSSSMASSSSDGVRMLPFRMVRRVGDSVRRKIHQIDSRIRNFEFYVGAKISPAVTEKSGIEACKRA